MLFSRVVLPAPEGPISATMSPGCTRQFTSERSLRPPATVIVRESTDTFMVLPGLVLAGEGELVFSFGAVVRAYKPKWLAYICMVFLSGESDGAYKEGPPPDITRVTRTL